MNIIQINYICTINSKYYTNEAYIQCQIQINRHPFIRIVLLIKTIFSSPSSSLCPVVRFVAAAYILIFHYLEGEYKAQGYQTIGLLAQQLEIIKKHRFFFYFFLKPAFFGQKRVFLLLFLESYFFSWSKACYLSSSFFLVESVVSFFFLGPKRVLFLFS